MIKVVVAEWADFECPACAARKPVVERVLAKYPGQVRFVFKHFPLSMHPYAEKAARAAVAAQQQGKFWEMYARLFEHQLELNDANVERWAKEIGLDLARFKKDKDSEAVADMVGKDRKQGEVLRLASTPSFFINGRVFPPTSEFEAEFSEWIALELELTGSRAPATTGAPPTSAPTPP